MFKKILASVVLSWMIVTIMMSQTLSDSLKLHYTFETVSGSTISDITGNGYNATLQSGATIGKDGTINVLKLGTSNGYLDMGAVTGNLIQKLQDFTVATYLYVEPSVSITGNGNFAWAFSTSNACSKTDGKYIAYRVNIQRYAQSSGGWGSEVGFSVGTAISQGSWHHVTYTQSGTTGTLYVDGVAVKTGTISLKPADIATATTYNWLGRSPYSGDAYLKGASYADFRVYNRAFSASELSEFTNKLSTFNYKTDSVTVENAKANLLFSNLNALRTNLKLSTVVGNNVQVSWVSSDTTIMTNKGVIYRPAQSTGAVTVTLTAKLQKGIYSTTKVFTVTIIPLVTDEEAVLFDANNLSVNDQKNYFLGKVKLPNSGTEGSLINWVSAEPEYLSNLGDVIKLPAKGAGIKTVKLTATLTKGTAIQKRDFDIKINEDEGYAGYLFAYFIGNTADTHENIFFALSSDGYNYKALNSGNYIIKSDTISKMNGVRDPHIMRGPDGNYYMVVTDMRSSLGWETNHGIVLMKSKDLINWTHSIVDIKDKYSQFNTITRAWAPQTFYDAAKGKYMIYFSMKSPGGYDKIYYAYANATFTDLEAAPQLLFDNGYSTIDGDIIYNDGKYNLFFKTENAAEKGYKKAVSDNLTSGYVLIDKYLDQTTDNVEGACVYRLNNQEKYILMYDVYSRGRYEFTESDDLADFKLVTKGISMDFAPRHGTSMGITKEEAERLTAKWGTASFVTFGTSLSTQAKSTNIEVNNTANTVFIPVKNGTDLSAFDPQITGAVAGVKVEPQGAQNFSQGPISYTLSLNGTSKTYSVTSAINNNAVIQGYYADPEILYSKKNKKFYLYPTSDGFASWGGFYFKVFSSENLVDWSDEGVIIDMHNSNQITWANGNAWAPCIEEKLIDGAYKYVFYFSGGLNGGTKQLGYAVADDPTGPFTVSGAPLITSSPTGGGQQIDSDVFTDTISGKSYLYWGNGYMAVSELSDDLQSLKTTPKVITPSNYTEGTYVFYRNGKYYFLWSQGNTSNADYKVYYGYSSSPTGPITIPANNNILVKDVAKGINGPGHNSVIQIPGKDEWYIVYHRISRPNGITNTSPGPGNVREVCIDKLLFNADGTIQSVVPTLEGIQPVDISRVNTAVKPIVTNNETGVLLRVEIYNMAGLQMNPKVPTLGVFIFRKIYSSGYVKSEKVVITSSADWQRKYSAFSN